MNNSEAIKAYITARIEILERAKIHPSPNDRIDELKMLLRLIEGLDLQMTLLRNAIFPKGLQ